MYKRARSSILPNVSFSAFDYSPEYIVHRLLLLQEFQVSCWNLYQASNGPGKIKSDFIRPPLKPVEMVRSYPPNGLNPCAQQERGEDSCPWSNRHQSTGSGELPLMWTDVFLMFWLYGRPAPTMEKMDRNNNHCLRAIIFRESTRSITTPPSSSAASSSSLHSTPVTLDIQSPVGGGAWFWTGSRRHHNIILF